MLFFQSLTVLRAALGSSVIYVFLLVFTLRFARIRNLVSPVETVLIVLFSLLSLIVHSFLY